MSMVGNARAFANNAVAFVAWDAEKLPASCLGFELTRIDQADGSERVLAAWVPFEGQSNPEWKPQDTSVWPVQKFTWRDLTVRQRRDSATLRPSTVVKYRVRPLGRSAPGLQAVKPAPDPSYNGAPLPLAYLDAGVETNVVAITGDHGPLQVAFNNGILSTQWLTHAMEQTLGHPPGKNDVIKEIDKPASAIRSYLAGDLPSLFGEMFDKLKAGGNLYLALYELTDPVLFKLIVDNAAKVHLILSNTSRDKAGAWDLENSESRRQLHDAGLAEMHDRMFNNAAHIGHNKFIVYTDAQGVPRSVLSGSTNWTPNGLCAQSNNAYIAEIPDLAAQFWDYWKDLKRDNESFSVPAPISAGTNNAQGSQLRTANAAGLKAIPVDASSLALGAVRLWRSPNTAQKTKPAKPAAPPDLSEVFSYIANAQQAIFFAVFLPSGKGDNSVVSAAVEAARNKSSLLVYGTISSAMAMPNYIGTGDRGEQDDPADSKYQPSLFEEGKTHIVRANALGGDDLVGNFERELLSAGNAIIHDKILVIDPLSDDSVVVTGSHNLGFKASYANDDNLVIIRKNAAVAQAYMVHILDLYEHYRFRGVEAERQHAKKSKWSGFLATDDSWQRKYPQGHSDLSAYLSHNSATRD